jgi:2-polyprenyl-6-methoxyphenol hydroxylase-like FAD-dependent oxidoreductase
MAKMKKVLVVGGGIGGLSSAIALRKSGIEVDVLEVNKDWTVYHVGIIVQGNFIRALCDLGVGKEAVAAGYAYYGVEFRDSQTDEVLASLPTPQIAAEGFPSELGITRPALHEVLSTASLKCGANVRLGMTYTNMQETDAGVKVTFSDGGSDVYDLVIGADGAYSKTRKFLFGDKYKPRFTGQGVWRYNLPRPKDLDRSLIYTTSEDGRKPGFVPLSEDTMYIFVVSSEPGNPFHDPQKLHLLLQQRMEGFGGLVAEIKHFVTDPSQVVYRPMEVCVLPAPWYKGRVLLIGDAAHASTPHFGQGGGSAVEDAVVLGDLAAQGLSAEELLPAFMKRRFERARFIAEGSIQLGEWEMHPTSDADPVGLMSEMRHLIAEPI